VFGGLGASRSHRSEDSFVLQNRFLLPSNQATRSGVETGRYERDPYHGAQSKPRLSSSTRMKRNRATAGATFDSIMNKQDSTIQSKLVELSEQQLDNVAGGTKTIDKASAKLFQSCATGEHIKTATLDC
jgi:hypothetical protein